MAPSSPNHPHHDERLTLIRALLAKAEATEFAEEAESFRVKAGELIARYSIDEALVWATAGRSPSAGDVGEIRVQLFAPYLGPKAVLVGGVAHAFGCRAIRHNDATEGHIVAVCGFVRDLELIEPLVTSLFVQLANTMLTAERAAGGATGSTGHARSSWRRSYIVGFAEEVTSRITAQRRTAAAEHDTAAPAGGASVAVALRDREALVNEEVARRYPRLRTTRTSAGRSPAGRSAGGAAGRRADIGDPRLASRRSLSAGR